MIGYSYGFHLGGICGEFSGCNRVFLGIIEGIGLIAVIASPLVIISRVKRILERLLNTTGSVLEQDSSVSQGGENSESNAEWNPFQGVSEYGIIVSVSCFFGVLLGCIGAEVSYGSHPDGILNGILWLIGWPFLGGLLGLMGGSVFALVLWALMKILHFPHLVLSRIIRYARAEKPLLFVSELSLRILRWLRNILGMLTGLSFLLFLLFFLMLGCLGGFTFGFDLGDIWGGIFGIVITPLLAVVGGIALIALVGSPFWIVPKVRRGLERLSSAIRQALGRPCPESGCARSYKSKKEWGPRDDADMKLALIVSLFSFYGAAGGYMTGGNCGPPHGNGWNITFGIIGGAFQGGFLGLLAGFLVLPILWGLVKILGLPYRVFCWIIRSLKA
jgi:hypothetical protein